MLTREEELAPQGDGYWRRAAIARHGLRFLVWLRRQDGRTVWTREEELAPQGDGYWRRAAIARHGLRFLVWLRRQDGRTVWTREDVVLECC